ncbi:hypothetical protein TNIN_377411 [Trichonephila inaurata madagascariensis]|uniref:Uncharacterized protein n=1 Tax=Trichonephila inaurata madagascariensis TaxID=2747483 RepID=A0A8X6YDX3_9ARAC|nr:hypothetical protein TNIN_377411 [Trichonephila inaurata madagascariensis]
MKHCYDRSQEQKITLQHCEDRFSNQSRNKIPIIPKSLQKQCIATFLSPSDCWCCVEIPPILQGFFSEEL